MFKKSFIIEIDDSLKYPNAETICNLVEKYAVKNNEILKWESKEEIIKFYLSNVLYEVKIHMIRGGYEILCKEV